MYLREFTPQDALLLFQWRCNPATVRSSFTRRAPTWDEHLSWVAKQDHRWTLIGVHAGIPVGCIRFTPDLDRGFEVHIVVAPGQRGLGYGPEMLRQGIELLPPEGEKRIDRVAGYIRVENEKSRRAFVKAGFTETFVVSEWRRQEGASPLRGEGGLDDLTLA